MSYLFQAMQVNKPSYEYRVVITRIIDGDTLECDVDLGFGTWMRSQVVRILKINSPEMKEHLIGDIAKEFLGNIFPIGSEQILISKKTKTTHKNARDKYGRILGDFFVKRNDEEMLFLSEIMISSGQAKLL